VAGLPTYPNGEHECHIYARSLGHIIDVRPAFRAVSGERWGLYFYVPRKTEIVGLYAEGSGTPLDGAGDVVFTFSGRKAGFYGIQVPEGQDGRLWKFHNSRGVKRLVTVPPCLAVDAGGLLLPREVVEADCDY